MMSATWGIVSAISCLVLCEMIGFILMKRLGTKGVPYEIPHLPVLVLTFSALYAIEKVALFSPTLRVLVQFGMLYCMIAASVLLLLAFIRQIHYQSYIFILNWLKK